MYTPEQTFIRELENYFDEKYNDFTCSRIQRLLSEYLTTIKQIEKEKEERIRLFKIKREAKKALKENNEHIEWDEAEDDYYS